MANSNENYDKNTIDLKKKNGSTDRTCNYCGQDQRFSKVVEARVDSEAQQGDGPAATSASSAAVGENSTSSSTTSVVIGPNSAAAACDIGVVVVGPHGAAAASEVGVVSVGPDGAAASSNAANSSSVVVNSDGEKTVNGEQKRK